MKVGTIKTQRFEKIENLNIFCDLIMPITNVQKFTFRTSHLLSFETYTVIPSYFLFESFKLI